MRISDWSSDVCSSDLGAAGQREIPEGDRDDALAADLALQPLHEEAHGEHRLPGEADHQHDLLFDRQAIGRASCRERVVSVRVDLGGRRIYKKKKIYNRKRRTSNSIIDNNK